MGSEVFSPAPAYPLAHGLSSLHSLSRQPGSPAPWSLLHGLSIPCQALTLPISLTLPSHHSQPWQHTFYPYLKCSGLCRKSDYLFLDVFLAFIDPAGGKGGAFAAAATKGAQDRAALYKPPTRCWEEAKCLQNGLRLGWAQLSLAQPCANTSLSPLQIHRAL